MNKLMFNNLELTLLFSFRISGIIPHYVFIINITQRTLTSLFIKNIGMKP